VRRLFKGSARQRAMYAHELGAKPPPRATPSLEGGHE
jgi:hypothetical protein